MKGLTEATKKSLDEELFEYHTIAREIALRKLELDTMKEQDDNIGGSRSGHISKIPEERVIAYSGDKRIQYLERLKRDVDQFKKILSEEQQKIFELRWSGTDTNTWEEIATKIHCSEKSTYRKREKMLEVYARVKGKL